MWHDCAACFCNNYDNSSLPMHQMGGGKGFPLEHRFLCLVHRFLCLVHVLTVVHVLTPVNVHHRRYDAYPTATLVPTLIWFKCIHVNPIYLTMKPFFSTLAWQPVYQFMYLDILSYSTIKATWMDYKLMFEFQNQFMSPDPYSYDIETNWLCFKSTLNTAINKNILQITPKSRNHLPWLNCTIRKRENSYIIRLSLLALRKHGQATTK